jgi:vacuolar-type H+-ATPase subunit H
VREVIQKLIAVEEEAKDIVKKAQEAGAKVVQEARDKTAEIIDRSRAEVRLEAERVLQAAAERTSADEQGLLTREDAEIESAIRLDPAARQRAVQAVVQCACGLSQVVQEHPNGASGRS